jgi:Domain of unknown function (DUF4136)
MKTDFRFSAVAAVILTFMILGGCATVSKDTVITYSYEPRVSFPELRTYQWTKATPMYRQDPLLEANVRFLADRDLEAKGLTSKTDKPDLLIWISYSLDTYSYGYGHELRVLTLNISRAHNNELIWRGMATGSIRTDAASADLKKAVEEVLVNFPPK